jgi:hypothetical protein
MNQTNAQPSPAPQVPRGAPAGLATEPLDFDEVEKTTPSTPYPGGKSGRLGAVGRWFAALWRRATTKEG